MDDADRSITYLTASALAAMEADETRVPVEHALRAKELRRRFMQGADMTDTAKQQAAPTIPVSAVEAAAKAVYGGDHLDGSIQRDAWLRDFRIALEAALPHLVADGWVRRCPKGCSCGCHNAGGTLEGHEMGYCPNG